MNTSNAFEIVMTASLTALVVVGLVGAGMTAAVMTGSAIGCAYLLAK